MVKGLGCSKATDSAIHRINLNPVDSAIVSLILNHWVVIYPVDSAIQRSNNQDQIPYINCTKPISNA